MKLRDNLYGFNVEEHGGSCCGIHHVFEFPSTRGTNGAESVKDPTNAEGEGWLRSAIEDILEDYYQGDEDDTSDDMDRNHHHHMKTWRTGIECVLADYQLKVWKPHLEKVGFKQVFTFHNSNSGNNCTVFYYETNSNPTEVSK